MPLPDKRYSIIYADPAWKFNAWSSNGLGRSAHRHYHTMTLEDIKRLPISNIADNNCILFLWAIDTMLPQALEVINSWGFEYKTVGFTWVKLNKKSDTPFFGQGFWTRKNPEQCLLATKGKPKRISAAVPQLVRSKIREHSRKPDEVRERIVELMGDLPRIELFARENNKGWDVWGDEVDNSSLQSRLRI
jgi:N6-adenosine-specific RNA methylase IME4